MANYGTKCCWRRQFGSAGISLGLDTVCTPRALTGNLQISSLLASTQRGEQNACFEFLRSLCEAHRRAWGLQDRARLLLARPEIADAYAGSHLFAMPSRWEGFPNALAEATAHGLPAVGFAAADGVRHLIEDGGETGWLARGVDDPAALAEMLDRAMGDPTESARRGARAANAMRAYPSDAQFDKWQTMVEGLAGAERSGGEE